ncbi:hypothetical protein MHEL_31530 [Mycolicibacterium helvum]|uniref:Uncharacterized protein n=1 Tax=Mycolicibacterium helvum TaxID=1534349 RepID=A0A7I7T7D4_9MYCO|nr:hypothetical protein MHEL_31530 [Mycolicibacterium helvum]
MQQGSYGSEVVTDGADPVADAAVIIVGFPAPDTVVEFVERIALGHRGQPVAPKSTDFSFHTALFVRAARTGLAVERVEAIV